MKTKTIFLMAVILLIFSSISCNKDNHDNDPLTTDTYMRANINGTNWEANKTVAAYYKSTRILSIIGLDEDGQNGLHLTIKNYTGTGNYNIDENIVVQRQNNAYINPGGNAGFINITSDNGVIYKGKFECNMVNVLNPDEKLEIKNGEFKASTGF